MNFETELSTRPGRAPGEGIYSKREIWRSGWWHPSLPIFVKRRGLNTDRLETRGLGYILTDIGEDLGLHLHPHKFRHSAIRNWVRSGMPLQAIMQLSGHSSLKLIEHYSRLERGDVEDLYANYANGNGSH